MINPNAISVLERRYYHTGEDWPALCRRVATNIASAERKYNPPPGTEQDLAEEFYEAIHNLDFLPNSPTLMNAGGSLQQLSACFVLPVPDSTLGIFKAVTEAAMIHKTGGGTGFDFSNLRPAGSLVSTTGGVASGPVSFIDVFDAATGAIKQGGTRRGANMAILRVDHPDIMHFISAKRDPRRYTNFNISVGITDKFMEALYAGNSYPLRSPHMSTRFPGSLSARSVWNAIISSALETGDPGVVFLDTINESHPNPHLGNIASVNPCGEQPLLPYESCTLGSINLSNFVEESDEGNIDWERLGYMIHLSVRFLDDVLDVNRYPLPEVEAQTLRTRRIGLGVMGWADMLIKLGISYDSPEALAAAHQVGEFLHNEAVHATNELADERGRYPAGGAAAGRNTSPTTIAPTGTISLIAGVSSGIEPIYAKEVARRVTDGETLVMRHPLLDEGYPEELFRTAHEVSWQYHVDMQAAWQAHIHNAVSKTINMPRTAGFEDVDAAYRRAYTSGCKGITVYRDGSKGGQVLTSPPPPTEVEEDCDD